MDIELLFQTIEKLSGVIAMLIAWLFVVSPAMKIGINSKSDTITTATLKSDGVKRQISYGLVIGAIFQAIFSLYLMNQFYIPLSNLGIILYLSANLATICVAIFAQNRHPRIHDSLVLYYFIVCPLSLLFIGISIESASNYHLVISIISPIIYFIGQSFLWLKYRTGNAFMEFWAFFVLSTWTVLMTFI